MHIDGYLFFYKNYYDYMIFDAKGKIQPETVSELLALTNIEKGNRLILLKLSKVTFSYLSLSRNKTLVDYQIVLDNSSILHVLNKHGNDKLERLRGQFGIVPNDFEFVEQIVKFPDSISFAGMDKSGNNELLEFRKVIGRIEYICIQEIRTKKERLCLKTMYKKTARTTI